MVLSEWVHRARKHAGLTLAELGEKLDRTKANVGHWESGKHLPSYAQVKAISVATGYPMPDQAQEALDRDARVGAGGGYKALGS